MLALVLIALPMAHAHNDYEHKRPLYDALSYGFRSVEADVYLVDGKLLVAHDRKDVKPSRTLKSLYLDPLQKEVRAGLDGFTLMIDVKADGAAATRQLISELQPYRWMITTVIPRQVKVVVSGAGDREVIAQESSRMLSIDGRIPDLVKPKDRNIAWVSDNWSNQFKWNGTGEFTEGVKLKEIVDGAHARGYRLRFWATPEKPPVWKVLRDAGVDLIGTDNLGGLAKFFTEKAPAKGSGQL